MEHMHKMCKTIMGLLMVIAGAGFVGASLNYFDGVTATIVSGAALMLFGLGKIAHAFMICPMCKDNKKE